MSTRLGEDLQLEEVFQEGPHAVVLATGAWQDIRPGVRGEGAEGYFECLDFLGRANAGQVKELSGKVIVIGGGDAALDTARSALRLGPRQVMIVYRRSGEEMPANPEEVQAAEQEGVQIRYLVAPKKILVEDGRVSGLELVQMRLGEADRSGRRRPVPVEGSTFTETADMVIPAIGQRPHLPFLRPESLSKNGTVRCDKAGCVMGYQGLFAAGDTLSGPSTVVEAMGSGKTVARQVVAYLEGVKGTC
jgi:formate dehydrogenase major subunit